MSNKNSTNIQMVKYLTAVVLCVLLLQCLTMISYKQEFQWTRSINVSAKLRYLDLDTKTEQIYTQWERKQLLREYCRNQSSKIIQRSIPIARNIFVSDKASVIYCSVPKVACTNWKRVLQVIDGRMKNLFTIEDKEKIHEMKYIQFSNLKPRDIKWRTNSYYSFMFVRHPFERLFSAYRNKLQNATNTYFQRFYGKDILKLFRKNLSKTEHAAGKNVTFLEFLKYLIHLHKKEGYRNFNEHWQKVTNLCSPCTFKYDFIGTMDTLVTDSKQVLTDIGLNKRYTFPYNATDKYKQSAKSLQMNYYSTIPKYILQKIYAIFKDDFDAFGYTVDGYF